MLEYEFDDELLNGFSGFGDNLDLVFVFSGCSGIFIVFFVYMDCFISLFVCDDEFRVFYGVGFEFEMMCLLLVCYFFLGGLDSIIWLWDSVMGRCLKIMFGYLEGIWVLVGDMICVISGVNDGMVKCWELWSGKCDVIYMGYRGLVMCVGFNDSFLVSGSEDGEVCFYFFKVLN